MRSRIVDRLRTAAFWVVCVPVLFAAFVYAGVEEFMDMVRRRGR